MLHSNLVTVSQFFKHDNMSYIQYISGPNFRKEICAFRRFLKTLMTIIAQAGSYLLCITFICSGLLKAVNVEAFAQTVRSFFGLLGLDLLYGYEYVIAVCVCFMETFIGFVSLNLKFMMSLRWVFTVIIGAFTWITYINFTDIYGGIESCGCFGELIHMDAGETLSKNVVLLALSLLTNIGYVY